MIGLRIEDFVAPALLKASGDLWSILLEEGRQDGTIEMVHKSGQVLRMRYVADVVRPRTSRGQTSTGVRPPHGRHPWRRR